MSKRVENPKLLNPIGNARVANFKSMVLFLSDCDLFKTL